MVKMNRVRPMFREWHEGSCMLCAKLLQPCPTLGNLWDCSPPGFSVHRILQARILECPSPGNLSETGIKPMSLEGRWEKPKEKKERKKEKEKHVFKAIELQRRK